MQKKLLLLGGSNFLLPVIQTAHELGLYVITCDYLPDNIAHQYSDEYVNESVIDKEAVLEIARRLRIDGVMSFACDPGVVTAAYVAEEMGLPFQCSYRSAMILQDKGLFRNFLMENGFNCPHAKRYEDENAPFKDIEYFNWPVIVKPADSAGSKGVARVDAPEKLREAIKAALREAHNGAFIIEDFLTFYGYHSSTDSFTVNGDLKFITYSDHLFDKEAENPYIPICVIWPSSMKQEHQDHLTVETQRLMKLLGMKTGIYNIESCIGNDGKPYLMEVSPRGAGCGIAEIQKMAYGVDLIKNEILKAVGMPIEEIVQPECDGHWCEMVIHARRGQSGIYKDLWIDPEIRDRYVKTVSLSVRAGDMVRPFTGANMSLGNIFLRFESREELDEVMGRVDEWIKILCV